MHKEAEQKNGNALPWWKALATKKLIKCYDLSSAYKPHKGCQSGKAQFHSLTHHYKISHTGKN